MQLRIPKIDFSQVDAIWAPANPAFGHKYDGASLLLPYLEPYLIKVMREAQEKLVALGLNTPELDRSIKLFNQQEGQHYQLHSRYNDYLKSHYPGLERFEQQIKSDFEHMLNEQSLAYNLAYSTGFETIGPIQTPLWFSVARDARDGANPQVDALWSWHLSEEFEHRSVAFDAYQLLVGSWRYRLKMFHLQNKHLENFTHRVMHYMMEEDDKAGRYPLLKAQQQWRQFNRRFRLAAIPQVISVALPWHNPAKLKPPADSLLTLNQWSTTPYQQTVIDE